MYRISPFTPIFFNPSGDKHGPRTVTVQVFANSDRILLEIIATNETEAPPDLTIRDLDTVNEYHYSWGSWVMNDSTTLYFIELLGMADGLYQAVIGENESEPFYVTSDESFLEDTVLLQYSNRDNRQRNDAVFWIDGKQKFFDFRVPGGFKDDNWSFGVSNEQFLTSDNDMIDLYSQESTIKALTVGNSDGCPIWFAEMLNRLLCCNYVYVDNIRYIRNESEVPEVSAEIEGLKSYIFSIGLRRVVDLDPVLESKNMQLILRSVEYMGEIMFRLTNKNEGDFRIIGSGSVGQKKTADDSGIEKPYFLTDELMSGYRSRKCKIGGFIKNDWDNTQIPRGILEDARILGFDYVKVCYTNHVAPSDRFDKFLVTLQSADEVGIGILASHRVFCNTNNDYNDPACLDRDRIEEAIQHPSFEGTFRDEPSDTDINLERSMEIYNIYKDVEPTIKMDLNLLPSHANGWQTTYRDYLEKFAQCSDTVSIDFYPIQYNSSDGYSVIEAKYKGWAENFNDLLYVYHKYPEKEYRFIIQTSSHRSYGKITREVLSAQIYGALIGGVEDIKYFCLTDNLNKDGYEKFLDSPYKYQASYYSDSDKQTYRAHYAGFADENIDEVYAKGTTYDVVKRFNDSKFKYLRNYIPTKYIYGVDVYKDGKFLCDATNSEVIRTMRTVLQDFIETDTLSYNAKFLVSLGYDEEAAYCFIVNIDMGNGFQNNLIINPNATYPVQNVNFSAAGAIGYNTAASPITISAGDICILRIKYKQ